MKRQDDERHWRETVGLAKPVELAGAAYHRQREWERQHPFLALFARLARWVGYR